MNNSQKTDSHPEEIIPARQRTRKAARRAGVERLPREHKRLTELERAHQREQVLNALLRLSLEEIPLETQLERALDKILALPWLPLLRRGGIFLVPDDGDQLELWAQQDLDPEVGVTCRRVRFGQCLCGQAAATGQIQFAACVDPSHEIQYEGMAGHGHYCVPIQLGGRTIGTIVFYVQEGQPWDADQEEFLHAVAHTLAGMIQRKRTEEQLRALNEQLTNYGRDLERKVATRTHEIERRRQVAESLRGMLAVLNSNRPLDEILHYIVEEAGRLLGSDATTVYRWHETGGAGSIEEVQGQGMELFSAADLPIAVRQELQMGQPVAVGNATSTFTRESAPGCLANACLALLAVPLIVAGEGYGALVLYYSRSRQFSPEEVNLAVAFADQAALALENARLHQQAQQAAVLAERGRLARELHDSVTQSLYSITLLAEGWRRLEAAGRLDDKQEPLTEIGAIAQQALKEMRLLVHELRPPDLEAVGLLTALHSRLSAVEKRAGIEARLVADDVVDLPPDVEAGLYRIAVEALNNALKHAAATSVTVHLRTHEGRIELEVEDNGQGFDMSTLERRRGLGLDSMKERAEKLGGRLTIYSAPGEGTKVRVSTDGER